MMFTDVVELLFSLLPWICALLMLFALMFEIVDALHQNTREREQRAQANKMGEELFAIGKDGLAPTQISDGDDEFLQDNHMLKDRVHDTFYSEAAFLEYGDDYLLKIKQMKDADSIEDMAGIGVLGRGYLELRRLRMPRELEAFYPENGSTGLTPDAWSVAPVVGAMQQ